MFSPFLTSVRSTLETELQTYSQTGVHILLSTAIGNEKHSLVLAEITVMIISQNTFYLH